MSTDPIHAQRVGAVLGGRYRLARVLGAGGMGAVYEAADAQGQRFAVKVLLGMVGDRDATARFAREARLMATLSHANITRIVDSGVDTTIGAPYLVMELLSGEDVESLVTRCGPLSPALAARIVLRASAGIEAAHAAGIIHRDIKPANIFLHDEPTGEITVKVCDFGIAKSLFAGETMTRSGDSMGSPSYMSPEQARDAKRVDGRTDVWSLGMTLYELLTGVTAFDHAKSVPEIMIMLGTRDAPSVQQRAPWVSEALALVLHGTLVRDVDERCPNVGALMSALRPLTEGSAQIDRRAFERLPRTVTEVVAPRIELPRSWRDVEARVRCELPTLDRESTMVRLLGRTLGNRYRLLGVLGRGGMGAVYETLGPRGERLAVKVIHGEGGPQKPDTLARFVREAKAVMTITSEHVVRVIDADTDPAQQVPFIVMELLQGQDLADLVRSAGPLEAGPIARVFVQACRGLGDAHAHGIVHRDIKPANIFLHEMPSGEVVTKICDFGVAKQLFVSDGDATSVDLTRTGGVVGSPMYFSPEQARDAKNVDHRADVWGLAMSLYEALSGKKPWESCSSVGELIVAICTQDVPALHEVAPWVAPELAAVVHRGLRREPGERYATMADFAAALEPFTSAPRVGRSMLVPVGPERRANATAHRFVSVGSKTAYADTLSANHRTDAPKRRSSMVLLAAGALAVTFVVGGVAFRRPLTRLVRHREGAVATAEPQLSSVAIASASASVSAPAPAASSVETVAVAPSAASTASASTKVPARGGRRPARPALSPSPSPPTAPVAPKPTSEFLPDQRGN